MDRRALLLAFVVALLGVVLLVLYTKRYEREMSGGDKVKLLIAIKPIERGKPITDDMLSTRDVPQAYVEDRAIKEVDKPKILGLAVGTTIQAQQTLMWTDLATANEERRDLSALIVPGSRAVSLRTRREDASAAMVKPGDYVDVIAVLPDPNAPSSLTDARAAIVLLQKVLVLASGYETSPDAVDLAAKERKGNEAVLTLSMKIEQAQAIAVAMEKGQLQVVLRNPNDNVREENLPKYSSSELIKSGPIITVTGPRIPTAIPAGNPR
jgi:pilus assembly protein CpaB